MPATRTRAASIRELSADLRAVARFIREEAQKAAREQLRLREVRVKQAKKLEIKRRILGEVAFTFIQGSCPKEGSSWLDLDPNPQYTKIQNAANAAARVGENFTLYDFAAWGPTAPLRPISPNWVSYGFEYATIYAENRDNLFQITFPHLPAHLVVQQ